MLDTVPNCLCWVILLFVFCFVFFKKWEPLTDTQGYRAFTRNSITGKGRRAKAYRKNNNVLKRWRPPCLLTQYLKQFTSSVKVGHTETKELRVAGVIRRGGNSMGIFVTFGSGYRKIMQPIWQTSRPPTRSRKRNQCSQFRWTSTKIMPVKHHDCPLFLVNQGFKKRRKFGISSSAPPISGVFPDSQNLHQYHVQDGVVGL